MVIKMSRKLLLKLYEAIRIVYWQNAEHCGSDFDVYSCQGSDNGPCCHYDFCRVCWELDIDFMNGGEENK